MIVDIILVIILIFGAFRGFQKGLLLELIQILAFFIAIIAGFKLMEWGAQYVSRYVEQTGLAMFISFFVIFIVIILTLNLIGTALKKLINLTLLGSIDDAAGAIIGLLKWALTISILIWIFGFFNVSISEEYTSSAMVYPFVKSIAPYLFELFSGVAPYFRELFDQGKEAFEENERQAFHTL